MAPQSVVWGRDNRGAMLRVIGGPGEGATRIENRLGEPAANPYLYLAAQIYAGLDGIAQRVLPPPASETPYAPGADHGLRIPGQLGQALEALARDPVLCAGLGEQFVEHYRVIKQSEQDRYDAASAREGTKAFRPEGCSTSDWCRCQPLDMMLGKGGRHMKVT